MTGQLTPADTQEMHLAADGFLRRNRHLIGVAACIAVGTLLRIWQLAAKPGWQVDEVTYTSLARNLLQHGTLNLPIAYGIPWTPFLFHPPFYPLLLARWFAVFGAGIYQARLLGVAASMLALALLARLLWKMYPPQAVLVTVIFLASDGWLLYIQRISYMENTLMVIIVAALLAYRQALDYQSTAWFATAGVLVGAAVIFKHTGAYLALVIAISWLIRRHAHRGHALLLAIAAVIIGGYVAAMTSLFDYGGHNWYEQQSLVQVQRSLGLSRSKGTLTSPSEFIHLASQQYVVFLPSLLIGGAGIVLLGYRLIRCARRRTFDFVRADALLTSWLLAGVLVFGGSALRYAQYFSLVLIPAYCYLWVSVARAARARQLPGVMVAAGIASVVAAGLWSFSDRVLERSDNAFQQVLQYAETGMPHSEVVVAESSIAYEIPQPWCSPYGHELTTVCQQSANYLITWQTYLQSDNPFHSKVLAAMLRRSSPVARFTGFSGTVIVWKVK